MGFIANVEALQLLLDYSKEMGVEEELVCNKDHGGHHMGFCKGADALKILIDYHREKGALGEFINHRNYWGGGENMDHRSSAEVLGILLDCGEEKFVNELDCKGRHMGFILAKGPLKVFLEYHKEKGTLAKTLMHECCEKNHMGFLTDPVRMEMMLEYAKELGILKEFINHEGEYGVTVRTYNGRWTIDVINRYA